MFIDDNKQTCMKLKGIPDNMKDKWQLMGAIIQIAINSITHNKSIFNY